ncbi:25946_t:CDS:2, partial [Racocetra persica]
DDLNDEIRIEICEKSIKRAEFVQSNTYISTSKKYPVYVEFYGIHYSIPIIQQKGHDKHIDEEVGKNSRIMILQNIHSFARPGELLVIMGPSGCEKTTLLNMLRDRTSKKNMEGTVKLNGHMPTKVSRYFVVYSTQDD